MKIFKTNKIKSADLVVGIPSFNEADNISFVVKQVDRGLTKYFPGKKAVIINADNNSQDGTGQVFLNTETITPKIYLSTPPNTRGKGINFLNLFRLAKDLESKAVVVVDADLKSITRQWIKAFIAPILAKSYDYLTPLYARHEYDGTITNQICYPLIYGLLATEIRQPIGGDFAFSRTYLLHLLKQRWTKPIKKYGVDIFMTINALTNSFKLGQISLGAKIHKPSAPKLGPMFTQVVSTLFSLLISKKEIWFKRLKVKKIPVLNHYRTQKPQSLSVDYKGMKATALWEFRAYKELLKRSLTKEVYQPLRAMYRQGQINIDQDLWMKIVYDILYAYETTDANSHLIEAMKPLYFGRAVSFIKHTLDLSYQKSEREIRSQARYFWKNKNYLLAKYK